MCSSDIGDLYPAFEREAEKWLDAADAASRWRRTLIAGSIALEIAHVLRDQPPDRAGRYLVWASRAIREHPPATPSETERVWHLAALAGMQELSKGNTWVLTTGIRSGSAAFERVRRPIGDGGHLAVALRRFPDEPRFHLTGVVAMVRPGNRGWMWMFTPSYTEFARLRATDTVNPQPRTPQDHADTVVPRQAVETLNRLARLADLVARFEALRGVAGLEAEIELYTGYLLSAAMNWTSALEHLGRVPHLTDEVHLEYLSHLLSGRVHRYSGDHVGAVAAFERALEIVPNAEAAATQLAAELFVSDRAGDRDRAYALLQAAHSAPSADDPWRLFSHGDARLWPTYMAQLREALR